MGTVQKRYVSMLALNHQIPLTQNFWTEYYVISEGSFGEQTHSGRSRSMFTSEAEEAMLSWIE